VTTLQAGKAPPTRRRGTAGTPAAHRGIERTANFLMHGNGPLPTKIRAPSTVPGDVRRLSRRPLFSAGRTYGLQRTPAWGGGRAACSGHLGYRGHVRTLCVGFLFGRLVSVGVAAALGQAVFGVPGGGWGGLLALAFATYVQRCSTQTVNPNIKTNKTTDHRHSQPMTANWNHDPEHRSCGLCAYFRDPAIFRLAGQIITAYAFLIRTQPPAAQEAFSTEGRIRNRSPPPAALAAAL